MKTKRKIKPATPKRRRTAGSLERVVGCRVALSDAEIRHILDKFVMDQLGRYDGETDSWTYPVQIVGKLCRALRKAANVRLTDRSESNQKP